MCSFRMLNIILYEAKFHYKTAKYHFRGLYRGFRDTGYLPFYFQGNRILFILLPVIWNTWFNIFVTSRDIENLGKNNYADICRFIRDICLFTSRDMGYLVQASF